MGWVRAVWAAVQRAQRWPGIATPTLWARTAGVCLIFGGVVVALITPLAAADSKAAVIHYVNAALAFAVGIVVLARGSRVTLWQFHLLVFTATIQITVSVAISDGLVAVAIATLYVFIACGAFFVAWPTAAVYLTIAIACCMGALNAADGVPWWAGLLTSATTAAVGILIIVLGRSVSKGELDTATGVPNRRGFERLISAEISRAHAAGSGPAVIVISIENYAAVHDEFGNRAVDTLMHQLVAPWQRLLHPGQILARRDDDEFVLMLPATSEQEAVAYVQRLRAATAQDFSAGVSAWDVGETASPVLERANTALRRARSIGRNRTMLESSHLPTLAVQLRDALAAETIDVRYQPIVRLSEGDTVVGVEALLRWSPEFHPDLTAAEVIRVAEDNDLIAALDHYVLHRACLDAEWMQRQAPEMRLSLSVNVSGLELVQKGYVDRVIGVRAATGWRAGQLILEVTESVIDVDRPASILALHDLRNHGIRIAIDDFGTGYSSLSRLQKLPTDLLKLDGSFTSLISSVSTSAPPFLQAVAGLGDALSLPIIVEGVETAHEATVLRGMGFPMAQGFFFGRPQSRDDVVATILRTRL